MPRTDVRSAPDPVRSCCNGTLFRGEQAIGGAVAHRLAIDTPFAVTAGFAAGGNRNNLVRVGVAGEF